MERRRSPRFPVDLGALVSLGGRPPLLLRIRNFSEQGLLLEGEDAAGTGNLKAVAHKGDAVNIRFSAPVAGNSRNFSLPAHVARVFDSGLGVTLDALDMEALGALGRAAGATAPDQTGAAASAPGVPPKAEAKETLAALRTRAETDLVAAMTILLQRMADQLVDDANQAASAQVERQMFDLITEFKIKQGSLKARFRKQLVETWEEFEKGTPRKFAPSEGGGDTRLSLVDKEEFGEWVQLTAVVARAESRYADELFSLNHRLSRLRGLDPGLDKETCPVGPTAIGSYFNTTLAQVEVPKTLRERIYNLFGKLFLEELEPFYRAMNQILVKAGVEPEIKFGASRRGRAAGKESPAAKKPEAQAAPDATPPDALAPGTPAPFADDNFQTQTALFRDSQPPPTTAPNQFGQSAPILPQSDRGGTAPWNFFGAARELMKTWFGGMQARGAEGSPQAGLSSGLGSMWPQEPPPLPAGEPIPAPALHKMLSGIAAASAGASRGAPPPPLSKRIGAALQGTWGTNGKPLVLAPEQQEAVQLVERLVGNMFAAPGMVPEVGQWLRQMEMPLLKATLENPALALGMDKHHPITEIINHLEALAPLVEERHRPESREIAARVDQRLATLTAADFADPERLSAFVDELSEIARPRAEFVERAVTRTVQTCEGQQRLLDAREQVESELLFRMMDRRLPLPAALFLEDLWRHVLLQTFLRQGPSSPEWRERLGIVDHLTDGAPFRPGFAPPPSIAGLVDRAAEAVAALLPENARSQQLLTGLRAIYGVPIQESEWVGIPTKSLTDFDAAPPPNLAQTLRDRPEHISPARWREMVEQASQLMVDEWMLVDGGDGAPQPRRLAWVGRDHRRFVFVDRRGIKQADLTLPQVAARMADGALNPADDYDLPVMERSAQRMIEQLHEEIARQATLDHLTGLINRREFLKRLERSVALARKESVSRVLAKLDLDHLDLINSKADFQTGDRYLQEIARLLQESTPEGTLCARLGDDAFALLIDGMDAQTGAEALEAVRKAVQNMRFACAGSTLSLTASIGFTVIEPERADAERAMKEADAACVQAKGNGCNRVERYWARDLILTHKYQMAVLLGEMMEAYEEGRLALTAQKIAPLCKQCKEKTLFEVAASLPGAASPMRDYFRAAEHYNRMAEIDRWTVKTLLEWMARQGTKLDAVGGCSINISGNALNDPDFAEFVRSELERTGAPGSKLCFELAESATVAHASRAVQFIRTVKKCGARVALDDFGMGTTSFSHLRRLPVDCLKIAGDFVQELHRNPQDQAMVKSINEVAHFLGKETVAEFVDSPDVLNAVRLIGVDYVQGAVVGSPYVLKLL